MLKMLTILCKIFNMKEIHENQVLVIQPRLGDLRRQRVCSFSFPSCFGIPEMAEAMQQPLISIPGPLRWEGSCSHFWPLGGLHEPRVSFVNRVFLFFLLFLCKDCCSGSAARNAKFSTLTATRTLDSDFLEKLQGFSRLLFQIQNKVMDEGCQSTLG